MLNIIHKKHKDRYRIQFCNENFYNTHQALFEMWKTRFSALSAVEKLQAWVLVLSCLRRPNDWFGGHRKEWVTPNSTLPHPLRLKDVFAGSPILLPPKLDPEMNLLDFLNRYRIKALPESCFRSLVYITDSSYPLKITSGVMTPIELLQIQISGHRIVALDEDFENWPSKLYSKRDFLGFVLHDLIHADHFFRSPRYRDAQLGFYRFIEKILSDKNTQILLSSPTFKEGFEYIISDMNSHPQHLFQTLHSLLYSTADNDVWAQQVWFSWINRINLSEAEKDSLQKINTADFSATNSASVETMTLRLCHFHI